MGTRGAIGWIVDGELHALYNHFDSYPEGLGRNMVAAAKQIGKAPSAWAAKARAFAFVRGKNPTPNDIARLQAAGLRNQDVSTGEDWYAWLRDCQGDILRTLLIGLGEDSTDFLKDSLFCEYAYIIDFDTEQVHFLRGFNTDPTKQWAWCEAENRGKYYGCSLSGSAPLSEVTQEHLAAFYPADD